MFSRILLYSVLHIGRLSSGVIQFFTSAQEQLHISSIKQFVSKLFRFF